MGTLLASCTAVLVTNLPAWLTSPPPRENKKLAPRRSSSQHLQAMVREIVDFPVPAKPFSQKMKCSSGLLDQLYISRRMSMQVFWRQVGSCCRAYELNGASLVYGKRLSGLSNPESSVSPWPFNAISGINSPNWYASPSCALTPPLMWMFLYSIYAHTDFYCPCRGLTPWGGTCASSV